MKSCTYPIAPFIRKRIARVRQTNDTVEIALKVRMRQRLYVGDIETLYEVNVIQLKMEFMNLFIFTFPACLKQHLQVELAFARGRFSDSALDFPSKKLRREDLQSLHRGPPGEPTAAQSRCKVCPS